MEAQQSADASPRAVAVGVLKGGVGKSVISVNTAERLGARGNRALLIDADPNGHATASLGYDDHYQTADHYLGDVILDDRDAAPEDIIVDTGWGFDFIPAHHRLENLVVELANASFGSERFQKFITDPLLAPDGEYDYIVFDTANERNKITDNALVAALNMLIPLTPGAGLRGFRKTMDRQVKILRQYRELNILALVPNQLRRRIDQQTADRELIEGLVATDGLAPLVPNFAYVAPDDLAAIDAGEWQGDYPKPGIRESSDIYYADNEANEPLGVHAPDSDQLRCFEELAAIVEQGGVVRE